MKPDGYKPPSSWSF